MTTLKNDYICALLQVDIGNAQLKRCISKQTQKYWWFILLPNRNNLFVDYLSNIVQVRLDNNQDSGLMSNRYLL